MQPSAQPMAISQGPSSANAVRIINGNSCGSGSVVGHYQGGSLILTNAHVAGTRVGREVKINTQDHGDLVGRVIMAAYSDKTLTDWAIVFVEGFQSIKPVPLSKNRPTGSHYTTGCPRCVWPVVSTDITTKDVDDDSPLWRWTPNAIGGQSGSGVWSDSDNFQYGLLTWSWGGFGAGQMTSEIYRQARGQTVAGAPRIKDLIDLVSDEDKAPVEEGFFMQAGITDLPIWAEDVTPPPVDPQNPDSTRKLMIEYLRELAEFNAAWMRKFQTEEEATGPNNGSGTSGGDTFGL